MLALAVARKEAAERRQRARDAARSRRPALLQIQQLSHRGTDPTVLAVQNGERGKPGFPLVPPGLRLRVANDPDTALQHAYGLTHEVGFAFVGPDATIRAVIDHPATSNEIADALSTLD